MNLTQRGKDKAARVPLDYFRRGGRRKWPITALLVAVTLLAVGAALATGWWRRVAAPGPVHFAHAAWETDCAACHAPFQPTASRNAWLSLGPGSPSDALCQHCHAGPPHHADRAIAGEAGSCSSCHQEHRGRQSLLSRPPDAACTRCHGDLAAHVVDGQPHYEAKITGFGVDHPRFRLGPPERRQPMSWAADPGRLRFNHQIHLLPGQRAKGEARPWTLGDIQDAQARERYRGQQPPDHRENRDPVQLTCAACHVTDAADGPKAGAGQAPRSAGDYMLPISYAQHCQACHPLTMRAGPATVEIPHRLQPDAVRRFLLGTLDEAAGKDPKHPPAPHRPLPGSEAKMRALEALLYEDDVSRTEQLVLGGQTTCGLCHFFEHKPGTQGPTGIAPTEVPRVWYPHARFSHRAHQGTMSCTDCHAGAVNSQHHTDVLLPDIDNCLACHAPAHVIDGVPRGGVRHDCVTCHRYHQGEAPLPGHGSTAQGVAARRDPDSSRGGAPGR
jgi:predicted CXXCH cytochrome family protein